MGIITSPGLVLAVVVGIPLAVMLIVALWWRPAGSPARAAARLDVSVAALALAAVPLVLAIGGDLSTSATRQQSGAIGPEEQPPQGAPGVQEPSPAPPPGEGDGVGGGEDVSCSPEGSEVQVVAQDIAFSEPCLAAPADAAFTLTLENRDEAVPHNVSIHSADPLEDPNAEPLFAGEVFAGVETVAYDVGPLAAGRYHFRCDVHPTEMRGVFVVE